MCRGWYNTDKLVWEGLGDRGEIEKIEKKTKKKIKKEEEGGLRLVKAECSLGCRRGSSEEEEDGGEERKG